MNAMVKQKNPRSLNEALSEVMAAHNSRRAKPKAKAKPPRAAKHNGFSRETAKKIEEAIARDEASVVDMVVTKEAQAHGRYELVEHKLHETVKDGKKSTSAIRVVMNRGGTPVERWYARGRFDQRQWVAILFYQSIWKTWIGEPRITANLEPVIRGGAGGALESFTRNKIAAKEGLRMLDQEVFFNLADIDWFHVWQNVVIWDEPAGRAGSCVGFCHKPAEAAAQLIVGTIAKLIANVIIDRPRHDFQALLLDIDAPRRGTTSGVIKEFGPLTDAEAAELASFASAIDQDTPLPKRGRDLYERWIVHGQATKGSAKR